MLALRRTILRKSGFLGENQKGREKEGDRGECVPQKRKLHNHIWIKGKIGGGERETDRGYSPKRAGCPLKCFDHPKGWGERAETESGGEGEDGRGRNLKERKLCDHRLESEDAQK